MGGVLHCCPVALSVVRGDVCEGSERSPHDMHMSVFVCVPERFLWKEVWRVILYLIIVSREVNARRLFWIQMLQVMRGTIH